MPAIIFIFFLKFAMEYGARIERPIAVKLNFILTIIERTN